MTTNAERDELTAVIESGYGNDETDCPYDHAGEIADAILAAGYRKPRTITTVEELDALPAWSVVRSEQATIWEKFDGSPTGDFWAETMTLGQHPSDHIALPATVLHTPEPTK